jgi:hypothetical protein
MRPFTSYTNDPLYAAAQAILEKVAIAPPTGYMPDMSDEVRKTLQDILDSVVDKQKKIKNAKFFAGGNKGVSFSIDGAGYVIVLKLTRMGSDDLVRGTMFLQKTGPPAVVTPLLKLQGGDSLKADFPTASDKSKMVKAITDLL